MVVLEEITNTFWGVTVSEGKRYSQKLEGIVHVSMAALEPGSTADDKAVSVMIHHRNSDFVLCSLNGSHVLQQSLDLSFNQGEEVAFYLKGKGTVHLTGYVVPGDDYDSADDEDFKPQSSFAESDDGEDSESSDEDTDLTKGSKKRKMEQAGKQSKKPRVEIVDDDDDDEENDESLSGDDDEDGENDSEEDEDDDEDEDEDGLLDSEATEDNKFHESDEDDESEMDDEDDDDDDIEDDDDDDEEDETPKQKNAKNKNKKPSALPAKQSKELKHNKEKETEKPEENNTVNDVKQQSQSETNEKKKKKKNKNKKNEPTASSAGNSSLPEKQAPSKSKIVEDVVIEDVKVGHGPEAKKGSTVHVYYTGKLPNGKLFDSKIAGKAFRFRLGKKEVIKGWEVGVEGMKVGGKRKLVIPPKMGYGSQKVGSGIPPNSTLHFEVELKAVS